MDSLIIDDVLTETRKSGINDKIAILTVGILIGVDQKKVGPRVAELLINVISPKLEEEETEFDKIEDYHYGITEIMVGCAIGLELGVLRYHHVKKIINDCWSFPYVGYGIIQYLTETNLLDELVGAALDLVIDKIIIDNVSICAKIRAGNDKAIGALVGQILKQHKADPATVKDLLFKKIRQVG